MSGIPATVKSFGMLCHQVSEEPSLLSKRDIIAAFTSRYSGDVTLLYTLLLPKLSPRIYYVQEKQLLVVLAAALKVAEDILKDEWNQNGCVAETALQHFRPSTHMARDAEGWCSMTLQTFNHYLDQFASASTNPERVSVLESLFREACPKTVYYFLREVKQDLRLNAGQRTVLEGLHLNAYEIYKHCANLPEVIRRVQNGQTALPRAPSGSVATSVLSPENSAPGPPSSGSGVQLGIPITPMLAAPVRGIEDALKKCPNGAYSEVKYDGERIQVHKNGDTLHFFSRSLKPMKPAKYASIETYLTKAIHASSCILDGEILMVDQRTSIPLPFGTLGSHKRDQFATACPCIYFFDILYKDGVSTMQLPLTQRRTLLKSSVAFVRNRVMFSELCKVEGEDAARRDILQKHLNLALCEGLEGLVIKDMQSVYEPRARHWLKIKKDYLDGLADLADLLVVGAWYGSGSRGGQLQTFLMGCIDSSVPVNAPGRIKTVCKVSNGLTDSAVTALTKKYKDTMISTRSGSSRLPLPDWLDCGTAHIPDMVVRDYTKADVMMIIGAELTASTSHTSGLSIRFPRILRLRPDKTVDMVTTLDELRQLFASAPSADPNRRGGAFDGLCVEDATAQPPGLFDRDLAEEAEGESCRRDDSPAPVQRLSPAPPPPSLLSTATAAGTGAEVQKAPIRCYLDRPVFPMDPQLFSPAANVMICHCAAEGMLWSTRGFMGRLTRSLGSRAQEEFDQFQKRHKQEGGSTGLLGSVAFSEVGPASRAGRLFVATMIVQKCSARGGIPTVDERALITALDRCVQLALQSSVRQLVLVRPPAGSSSASDTGWRLAEQWWSTTPVAGLAVVVFPPGEPSATSERKTNHQPAPLPPTAPQSTAVADPRQRTRTPGQQLRLEEVVGSNVVMQRPRKHRRDPEEIPDRERGEQRAQRLRMDVDLDPTEAEDNVPLSRPGLFQGVVAYLVPVGDARDDLERLAVLLQLGGARGGGCASPTPSPSRLQSPPSCTHVVLSGVLERPAAFLKRLQVSAHQHIVTSEWIKRSVERHVRLNEALFHPTKRAPLHSFALYLLPDLPLRETWAHLASSLGASVQSEWRFFGPATTYGIAHQWSDEVQEWYDFGEFVLRPEWLADSAVAGVPMSPEVYALPPPPPPPHATAVGTSSAAEPEKEAVVVTEEAAAATTLLENLPLCVLPDTFENAAQTAALESLIEEHGGRVVTDLQAAQFGLSTLSAFQSAKSSMSVVLQLKCLHVTWLMECVQKHSIQSPAGFLLLDYPADKHSASPVRSDPLYLVMPSDEEAEELSDETCRDDASTSTTKTYSGSCTPRTR